MSIEVFSPVDDGTILNEKVYRGKPWRNYGFGPNTPIAEYQSKGLYLRVGEKPALTQYQKLGPITETAEHTTKTINQSWTVLDKSQAEIDEIDRIAEIKLEQESSDFSHVTVSQANTFIDNHIDNITSILTAKTELKIILKKMALHIINGE